MDFNTIDVPACTLEFPPEVLALEPDDGDKRLLETVYTAMQQINAENVPTVDVPPEELYFLTRKGVDFPEIGIRMFLSFQTPHITFGQQAMFAWFGYMAGDRIGTEDILLDLETDDAGRVRHTLTVWMLMNKSTVRRKYERSFLLRQITTVVAPVSPIADLPDGYNVKKKAGNLVSIEQRNTPRKMHRLREEAKAKQMAETQSKKITSHTPISPGKRPREEDTRGHTSTSVYERHLKQQRRDAMQPSVNISSVDALFDS